MNTVCLNIAFHVANIHKAYIHNGLCKLTLNLGNKKVLACISIYIHEFVYLTYLHCLHAFLCFESMSHLTVLEPHPETHVQ